MLRVEKKLGKSETKTKRGEEGILTLKPIKLSDQKKKIKPKGHLTR